MNITMVIPSYWSRPKANSWHEGDVVYDHPTPIDGEDTLGRTLESIKILKNKKFKLVILACPTCDELEDLCEQRVREIVGNANLDIPTYIFGQRHLRGIKEVLKTRGLSDRSNGMLSIKGYSNVRNICLYTAHVLGSDVTILIDDDELFENPDWVDMAVEFMGKRIYGKSIYGMAGYYLNKYDEFYDDVEIEPWMTYFNRFGSKTKAFDKIIACDPRVKVTPFAFGGAMIIHKNMYQIVPFDSDVTRGEDIDYLINAKMFGYTFFLDNKLSIKHLPPKKNHPIWKRLREDIYRFLYEQAKIRSQYEVNNMTRVEAEEFDPYPGEFLKDDIKDKIYKTNVLLALEYLAEGNIDGCKESIKNIYLSEYEAIPKKDPFTEYRRKQRDWVELINVTLDHRTEVLKIMDHGNVKRVEYKIDQTRYQNMSKSIVCENLQRFKEFDALTPSELDEVASITVMRAYNEGEILFQRGGKDLELHLVVAGSARIIDFNDRHEEIFLSNIESGGVIGETFMVKTAYSVTGIANEFLEILVMKKADLLNLIQKEPTLGNKLLFIFLNRLYEKLDSSNIAFKDKILQNEDLDMY